MHFTHCRTHNQLGLWKLLLWYQYWGVNSGTENFRNKSMLLAQADVLPDQDPTPTAALARQAQHPEHFCNSGYLPDIYSGRIFRTATSELVKGYFFRSHLCTCLPWICLIPFQSCSHHPTLHITKKFNHPLYKALYLFPTSVPYSHPVTPAPAQQHLVGNSSTNQLSCCPHFG